MKSGAEQQKVSRPPNGEGMRPVVTPAQEVALSTRPNRSVSAYPENHIAESDRLILASEAKIRRKLPPVERLTEKKRPIRRGRDNENPNRY